MIPYQIISTGSKGNAVVLNGEILVDCGVPYKQLSDVVKGLKLVLLTHIHSDHFRPTTLRMLAEKRPMLRFGCCEWLVLPLRKSGVPAKNIDVYKPETMYKYGPFDIVPVPLSHDVPNCGYKIHFRTGKVFYATDTNNLNGITAKDYDLYMVEANYEDEEIALRIAEKKAAGEYAYEQKVLKNHLSKAKCDNFIYSNIGYRGEYVYLHGHEDKDEK